MHGARRCSQALGAAGAVKGMVLIRSIDIYRRIDGSWIQVGSNICAIPDPATDGELSVEDGHTQTNAFDSRCLDRLLAATIRSTRSPPE